MSQTGLGGRLRTGGGPVSGEGELLRSSSMSHVGLGGRGRGAGGGRGGVGAHRSGARLSPPPRSDSCARPLPLLTLDIRSSVSAAACWLARSWSCVLTGRALVVLFRNGLLNAS